MDGFSLSQWATGARSQNDAPNFFKLLLAIDPMFPYSISRTAWGRSSAGRALDWQSRGQGFDPPRLHPSEQPPSEQSEGVLLYGLLAQRLAQGTHNPWVEGSNPPAHQVFQGQTSSLAFFYSFCRTARSAMLLPSKEHRIAQKGSACATSRQMRRRVAGA